MISKACANRTLSPLVRCTSSRSRLFQHPNTFGVHNQRNFSAAKRRKPRKSLPPPKEFVDEPPRQVPKWAATTSVLIIPFMFAAWGASDWIFGNRTKGHNEGLRQEFLAEQRHNWKNSNNSSGLDDDDDGWLQALDARPTLFHCVIRKNSGLTHCLSGVKLGDVVEILEEGVGPDKAYNLCRLAAKEEESSLSRDTYGWFPIRWLQKLEHYESMAREQRSNILSRQDPN